MPKQAKPIKLKLDGKPFELFAATPVFLKIMSYLDSLPDDELHSMYEVQSGASVGTDRLNAFTKSRFSAGYLLLHGTKPKFYFGNKRAIVALRAEIKRQEAAEANGGAE